MSLRERLDPTAQYCTPPHVPCRRWEYATIQLTDWSDSAVKTALSRMGDHGWEMVTQRESGMGMGRSVVGVVLFFKRPLSEP